MDGLMGLVNIAGSSNGKTTDFGSVYLGSNPSPAAKNGSLKSADPSPGTLRKINKYMIQSTLCYLLKKGEGKEEILFLFQQSRR